MSDRPVSSEPLTAEEEAAYRAEFASFFERGQRFAATNTEVARLLATLDAARSADRPSLREAIEDAVTLLEAAPTYLWAPGEPDETIAALRQALEGEDR